MNGMMLYSLLGRGYLSTTTEGAIDASIVTEPTNVDVIRTSLIWPEDPDDELSIK